MLDADYFEGPEKKLEVYFADSGSARGLLVYEPETWAELLTEAACTILHRQSSPDFDAYLLSESSLFVFPHRVILKTCGCTTLLLVLPKLLQLAAALNTTIELVQYGHLRYKLPEQQLFPHSSFAEERAYLAGFFSGEINTRVLGAEGSCWYMLSVEQPASVSRPALTVGSKANDGDDILEIAMEGISGRVCDVFTGSKYAGIKGRKLAQRMTVLSGLAALLPGVTVDDWAFEPCGYSMNGLREHFYYTVHVTPERDFSYASFETNDPAFRDPQLVERVIGAFAPTHAVMTLTTRRGGCPLPAYSVPGFKRAQSEVQQLGLTASVCTANFIAADRPATPDLNHLEEREASPPPSPPDSAAESSDERFTPPPTP
jgi:S-adenosylmethionine decarboxylase